MPRDRENLESAPEDPIEVRDRKLRDAFRRDALRSTETIDWLTPERFALLSQEARAMLAPQVRRRLDLALALERT